MSIKEVIVHFRHAEQDLYGRLQGGTLAALKGDIFTAYQESGAVYALQEVTLLAPCRPTKVVCVGLNYTQHAAELSEALPEDPCLFLKPATSVVPSGGGIVFWPMVGRLDYEAELAVIIGKRAHRISEEDAPAYIFGYSIGNDVTARDLQSKDGQWTRCKGFDTFLPLGPAIVRDLDVSDLRIQALLNDEVKQDSRTSKLLFCVPYLVSFISHVMTLLPGDVIMTGTPSGIGPMQIGDSIEIRIEGIGSLVNTVVAPPA